MRSAFDPMTPLYHHRPYTKVAWLSCPQCRLRMGGLKQIFIRGRRNLQQHLRDHMAHRGAGTEQAWMARGILNGHWIGP